MPGLKFCLFAVLLVAVPAWSQAWDTASIPRSEFSVYAGYSLLTPNVFKEFAPESGWNAGIDIDITANLGVAIDFSQYFADYGLGAKTTPFVFLAGPRLWAPVAKTSKLRPFADFLAGGGFIQTGRSSGPPLFKRSNTLAWSAGGGADVRATSHFWFRGQAGYLHTAFTTWDSEVQQFTPKGHARIMVGILYRR